MREVTNQASRLGTLWLVVQPSSRDELGPDHPASILTALGWSVSGGLGASEERHGVDLMMGRAASSRDTLRGERRQMRTISAAMVGLSQRLRYSPVVVVLDDLHLADDMTWALARRLVDAAPVLGFTVVLSLRSREEVPFSVPEETQEIKLKPLSAKEMASMVLNGLLPGVDEATAVKIASTVQGFPLLGEELIKAMNEERFGDLNINELRRIEASTLLHKLIASRIEHLSLPARRILRAAAVLGLEPRQSELQGFGDAFQDLGGLMELESSNVLARTAGGGMRFPFPGMREVTLASIPERQLARLHRDAADVISRSPDAERRELEIGEHLLRSGQPQDAFDVLRSAAGLAQYEGHFRRATLCLELAYESGKQLGAHHMRAQSEVARDRGELLLQIGAIKEAEGILREASFAARSIDDASLAADLLRLHGRSILILGDIAQGRVELESTLTFAEQRGDVAVAVKTCIDLVEAADKVGERAQTAEYLRRGLELIDRLEPNELPASRIQLYNRLGRLELEQGNCARAIATFAQALDLTKRYEDRYQEAGLLGNLGGAYARQKEMDKALHFTERALRASEELGDFLGIARQSFNLALLKLSTGQTDSSRELLRRSHQAAGRAGWVEGLEMSQAALDKLSNASRISSPP